MIALHFNFPQQLHFLTHMKSRVRPTHEVNPLSTFGVMVFVIGYIGEGVGWPTATGGQRSNSGNVIDRYELLFSIYDLLNRMN